MDNILCFKSKLYSKCKTYDQKFELLTNELMHNVILKVNGLNHRIAEAEIYLYTADHLDSFTHRDEQQSKSKHFYFHRFKTGSYKSGTFKGMDIICDCGTTESYFGVLIRALVDPNDNYIDGPCKVVDHILKLNKAESIKQLLEKNTCDQLPVTGSENLCVEYKKNAWNTNKIFKSIRVGLYNTDLLDWWCKDYRFLIYPNKTKKYKHMVVASLYANGFNANDITVQTEISKKSVENYICEVDKGIAHQGQLTDLFQELTTTSEMLQLYGHLTK